MRLRRAARIDANQPALVNELRAVGAVWVPTGYPNDGWVGYRNLWLPVEIKDPAQPPSKRTLTDAEAEFLRTCSAHRLPFAVVQRLEDILAAFTELT